jgi:hypothetical protein
MILIDGKKAAAELRVTTLERVSIATFTGSKWI